MRKQYAPIPTPPDPEPQPPPPSALEALWNPAEEVEVWRNRIVGYDPAVPVADLIPHELNFRLHSAFQKESLKGIIAQVGLVAPVKVNKRTGRLVNGHLRVALALELGIETLPVSWVDLDEEEEALAIATLDPIAGMATWDRDNLAILLHRISPENPEAVAVLVSLANDARISVPENILGRYQVAPAEDEAGAEDGAAESLQAGAVGMDRPPPGPIAGEADYVDEDDYDVDQNDDDGDELTRATRPAAAAPAPAPATNRAAKIIAEAVADKAGTIQPLWVGTKPIALTAAEYDDLTRLGKAWIERSGLRYGFINWLASFHEAGDEEDGDAL